MKALARCANGCDASPHPPSKVLCERCLRALDAKMNALAARLDEAGK